ncbi:hypothetical protein GF325_01470 [Candidatus Bathyarchaeota archaeon]|nr:hypothetical protein [Candidatus Bathyarchaeota archaeon]
MPVHKTALRLIFSPGATEIIPDESREPTLARLGIGAWIGLAGFIIQGVYVIPRDEINFGDLSSTMEAFLNGVIGGIIGMVLFLMLWGFDTIVALALGLRKIKKPLHGSFAPFVIMPLITIPVHELFSSQLSLRGHSYLVFVFIIVFLSWHVGSFGILYSRFMPGNEVISKRLLLALAVLLALQISIGILFITQVPALFGATPQQFLEEYF